MCRTSGTPNNSQLLLSQWRPIYYLLYLQSTKDTQSHFYAWYTIFISISSTYVCCMNFNNFTDTSRCTRSLTEFTFTVCRVRDSVEKSISQNKNYSTIEFTTKYLLWMIDCAHRWTHMYDCTTKCGFTQSEMKVILWMHERAVASINATQTADRKRWLINTTNVLNNKQFERSIKPVHTSTIKFVAWNTDDNNSDGRVVDD